jgi:hypothetical protein
MCFIQIYQKSLKIGDIFRQIFWKVHLLIQGYENMTSKVMQSESIEDFLKNARIEVEYTEIVIVIRDVLSKWIGTHPISIISLENPKNLCC